MNRVNLRNTLPRRFLKHLPIASILVLNPAVSLSAIVFLSVVFSLLSVHYALSFLILCLPIISAYLERNLLDRILLPPFTNMALWMAIHFGLGIGIISYARAGEFNENLLKIQIVTLIVFPIAWFGYRMGLGPVPRLAFPDSNDSFKKNVIKPLVVFGWIFFLYKIVTTVILASTGALDRGDFGLYAQDRVFGLWTYFQVLPRFDNFGFFLFPLMVQKSGFAGKFLLWVFLLFYLLIAFTSGSRGLLMYPLVYIGVGLFFFRTLRTIKIDYWAIVSVLLLAPLVVFINHYRNTDAYRATRTLDVVGRLEAIGDANVRMKEYSGGGDKKNIESFGAALLTRSDSIIYELTPNYIPHAGFDNFKAILYTPFPTFLVGNKPLLLDANIVLWRYVGVVDRTGRSISLPADLYRRFSWVGIPFGVLFFYWIYGLFCKWCFRTYLYRSALLGTLLILFIFSYFQSRPFDSVLTTWWNFFYDLPKHIILLYLLYFIMKKILGFREMRGDLRLAPPLDISKRK